MTGTPSSKVDSFIFHIAQEKKNGNAAASATSNDIFSETSTGTDSGSRGERLKRRVIDHDPDVMVEYASPTLSEGELEILARPSYENGIPVLVEVRRPNWKTDVRGFSMGARLGNIVTGHANPQALESLSNDPDVVRIEISREAGLEELETSLTTVKAIDVHTGNPSETGENAIIGVIDSGLDVLHEAFRDKNGKTRILAYWDQYDVTGPAPVDEDGNNLGGTLYSEADINTMIAVDNASMNIDHAAHGTHVTSIAAGRKAGAFTGGMAPDAKIIFVRSKMDTPAGDPTSIGYSMSHVAALAFMDQIALKENKPIVVNVSQGMNGGAHDGSSTVEAAFDNFSAGGRVAGRVIVKSAGNEGHQKRHARFEIGEDQTISVDWQSKTIQRRADVLEFWYDSSDDLEFQLVSGNGWFAEQKISASNPRVTGVFPGGNQYTMALDTLHRDNGDTRLSIRITDPDFQIAHGRWTLQVSAKQAVSGGVVDGWIERNRDTPINFLNHIEIDGTVTVPGTAHTVVTVAAMDREQNSVTNFSSRGTTRNGGQRPDVGAPGLNINAAKYKTANDVMAMPGTSMAAPHVTGAVALLLSKQVKDGKPQLNSNQVRMALRLSARGFNGRWNSARGWGGLNVEKLLKMF